ncbi:uncharacterized protein PRCAT00004437001 [Priceomyces carsonii]|uniref:uncharacterized protein n=1 Tax=Priceomyces carsonii TaxID=28549 RepID=UPI002EDAC1F9|nr:unnamed protein product [Priceomyces carsonii]
MEKGTLLELGLLPIITSALLWQLAAGLKLIRVNLSLASDRELFQSAQKLTSLFLALTYGLGLIFSGYYDKVIRGYDPLLDGALPYGSYAILLAQIVGWSFILTLMVEVFDKEYAFGGGIFGFLTLQVATSLVRDLISFEAVPLANSNKSEIYGTLIYLIRGYKNLPSSILNVFNRLYLPNFYQIYLVIITGGLVIYLQNFRIELPIRSNKVRGMNNVYPIRLLYNGALPVLFSFTVLANIQVFGFIISQVFELPFIGTWQLDVSSNNLVLSSGLLYYLNAYSASLLDALLSPIKSIVCFIVVIASATWFATVWSKISGAAPRDISKQFKDQGISILGKRDASITKELSRVIPVAAVSGASVLSSLAFASELLGGTGRGVAVTIGITSAFGILEEFMVEYQQAGGNSQFTGAFGG